MEKGDLTFKYNTCRIDLMVSGMKTSGTGFIYLTPPIYGYDYVLTSKHLFEEEDGVLSLAKVGDIKVFEVGAADRLEESSVAPSDETVYPIDDMDLAIIRIPKAVRARAQRIVVKNPVELGIDTKLASDSFLKIQRNESTRLQFCLKDKERGIMRLDDVVDVANYDGTSGSGVYCCEEPALVGVLAGYRLNGFEQKETRVAVLDWDVVNDSLRSRGWGLLNREGAKYTRVTEEKEVLDSRALFVNGACLNMNQALAFLQHDLADDWFFDPLHYIDLCNTDFVLNHFSKKTVRENYSPERLETFYLPKKSFVLRKALVGTFVDRLIYTAVVNHLGPVIERHLCKYVFSARYTGDYAPNEMIANGVEQWTKMKYYISGWSKIEEKGCIVRLDLLNFYDSINKIKLIRLLKEVAVDDNQKACVALLEKLLKDFGKKEDTHGIPQNCDASAILATFYVSHIDEIICGKAIRYCRFIDDMCFMAKDVYEARSILQSIEKDLREIDLSLNAQKVVFYRLDVPKDIDKLKEWLSPYDEEKVKIKHLINSQVKARRMSGVSLLLKQIDFALEEDEDTADKRNRALTFSAHAFMSYKLRLSSFWDSFKEKLCRLANEQIDIPDRTPLICRLIAEMGATRDVGIILATITELLLRKRGSIYEWQAYHMWLLLASLKYENPEIVQYAIKEAEANDQTKTVEVAAIYIYLATIIPEYPRVVLHRLQARQLRSNFQKRCALVAIRNLDPQVLNDEEKNSLGGPFREYHTYLNKHKEKDLVLFYHISSNPLLRNESILFPELYSGR